MNEVAKLFESQCYERGAEVNIKGILSLLDGVLIAKTPGFIWEKEASCFYNISEALALWYNEQEKWEE